jgi:hypothetical protein
MPVLSLNSGKEIQASSSMEGGHGNSTKLCTELPSDCSNDKASTVSSESKPSHPRNSSRFNENVFQVGPRTQSSVPIRMKRTSLLLFTITLIQWLSFLPYFALLFIRTFSKDFLLTLSEVDQVFYNIGLVTHYLSSGINPYLYGFLGRDFKKECRKAIMSMKNLRRN